VLALSGQYILKNVVLVASAGTLYLVAGEVVARTSGHS
jgi:hypothetical protein